MRRLLLLTLVACSSAPAKAPSSAPEEDIELVESVPLETERILGHADIRNAKDVWPQMIDRATKTLDFEEFYLSDTDEAGAGGKSGLTPTLDALDRAHKRGVKIRVVADAVMAPKYPATLDRLRSFGAEVRIIDCKPRYGGVQHAKFFVVDGTDAFVGSQNFDWRALDHIQEMGVRLHSAAYAGALSDVFATDWGLADPKTPSTFRVHEHSVPPGFFASPAPWLPDNQAADLPHIVALLDGAKTHVDLQVLTYSTTMRDKSTFTTLDDALRRAAGRGVKVRVMVSSWGVKPGSHELASVQALATVPNIEVHSFTIPPFSGGDIPFARVAHSKFLIIDDTTAWVGTSNWEGDYFTKTRNVAVVTSSPKVVTPLKSVFVTDWGSPMAATVAPRASTGSE
jgi:phosphatidylserine/phosphatidylglycerophosphate/cardiolipin synthase-like enzyme